MAQITFKKTEEKMNDVAKNVLRNPMIVRSDFDDARLSDAAIGVYVHLCRRQGSKTHSWPSIASIAAHRRCDRKTVFKALKELVETGWIAKKRRGCRSSFYTILNIRDSDGTPLVPLFGTTGKIDVPRNGTIEVPRNGTMEVPQNGTTIVPGYGTHKGFHGKGSNIRNSKEGGVSTPFSAFPSGNTEHSGASAHQQWDDFGPAEHARLITAAGSEKCAREGVEMWSERKLQYHDKPMPIHTALAMIVPELERRRRESAPKFIWVMVSGNKTQINPLETIDGENRFRCSGTDRGTGLPAYSDEKEFLSSPGYKELKVQKAAAAPAH